jgi:hypothetical protein
VNHEVVCLFRESPDETFVELVDVSVLQTLPLIAGDGNYCTIICIYILYMVQHTRNGYKFLAKILKRGDYLEN